MTRLPGHWPGLLRRGSPVAVRVPARGAEYPPRGIVAAPGDLALVVLWRTRGADDPDVLIEAIPGAYLSLDLADPTGQVHAAWWVRSRIAWDMPESDGADDILDEALEGVADPAALRELCERWAP